MIEQSFVVYLFIFYTILKDYFTFTVIKNIGYVPQVVQPTLESILHPIVCTFQSPTPIVPPYHCNN